MDGLKEIVFQFLENPAGISFEDIYHQIWSVWENDKENWKIEVKSCVVSIIQQITENISQIPKEGETEMDVELLKRQLEEFRRQITLLSNLFIYYDSMAEESERVAEIAVSTLLSKYLLLEQTVFSLQQNMDDIYSRLMRHDEIMPTCLQFVSYFIQTISTDLYTRIFNTTLTNFTNHYFPTVEFDEKEEVSELVERIYSIYYRINEKLSISLQSSTVSLSKELFCNGILNRTVQSILDNVEKIYDDIEMLRKVFVILSLGPANWVTDLTQILVKIFKGILNKIDESDFQVFGESVAALYVKTVSLVDQAFSGSATIEKAIFNCFVRFLYDHNFTHDLCASINKTHVVNDFVADLSIFVNNDQSFEDTFIIYLTHRLLSTGDVVCEENILDSLKSSEINLETAHRMLIDYEKAPKDIFPINGTSVYLVLLNRFCWPDLHVPEYEPPAIFKELFDTAIAGLSSFDSQRKSINISDRYSLVEFSDGKATFSLAFHHACIVQTVIEFGPISFQDLCTKLSMKAEDAKNSLQILVRNNILADNNGVLSFLGPPAAAIDESGENIEPERVTEDPVLFTHCQEQIDAAVVKFLKQKRFASVDEIKEAVFANVPKKFPVTEDKIMSSLQRLHEKEYIMNHGGKQDSYRYCRH